MSRKRGKQRKAPVEAVPEDVLAEGSGPVSRGDANAIATVEDVVTTDDIATTEDVITPDDVVATTAPTEEPNASAPGLADAMADAMAASESANSRAGRRGGSRSGTRKAGGKKPRGTHARDTASDEPVNEAADDARPGGAAAAAPMSATGEVDGEREGERDLGGELDGPIDGAIDAADDDLAEGDAAAEDMAAHEAHTAGDMDAAGEAAGDMDTDEIDTDGEVNGALPGEGEEDREGEDDPAVVFPTSAASMDPVQLKHLVEALVFASDRPLTVQRLRQLTRVGEVRRLEQALAELSDDYRERGLVLQQVSGGYQFRTRTQFSPWVQQLIAGRPVRLSRAQLETLAIIAYRQPITRPEIDDIRGVDSTATLKLLIDRMLIRVLGKREEVGRPMLYGTTKEFLDFFSLGDLRELPTLREYSELTAESRKVMSDRLGISPDGREGGDGSDGDGGDGSSGGGDGGHGGNGHGGNGHGGNGHGGNGHNGHNGHGSGPTGFGGGGLSDDGGHASAAATDALEAVAAFWAAADAVDRSDAAAVVECVDEEPGADLLDEGLGEGAPGPEHSLEPIEPIGPVEPVAE